MSELNDETEQPHPPEHVRSWPRAYESIVKSKSMMKSIVNDCAAAATARAQLSQGDYSHGTTFWVGAADLHPKTSLERLALDVFHAHVKRDFNADKSHENQRRSGEPSTDQTLKQWTMSDIDFNNSGAEWWALCMDEEDGGVGWHWHKDYHAELHHGRNIHPYLATISYFSNVGAPTLILPKHTTGMNVSSEDYTETLDGRPLTRAYLSRPVEGKHIYFDGRFLHAAPTDVYDELKERGTALSARNHKGKGRPKRATFLVNLWINHKPQDAIRLSEYSKLQSKLSNLLVSVNLSPQTSILPFSIVVVPSNLQTSTKSKNKKGKSTKSKLSPSTNVVMIKDVSPFSWELNAEHALHAELPIQAVADSWTAADTFLVSWSKGTLRPYIE